MAQNPGFNQVVTQQALAITTLDFWDIAKQGSDGKWVNPGYVGETVDTSNSWNYVSLDGNNSPGLVPLDNGVRVTKQLVMDSKKPLGANYATNTSHGVESPKFDINIKIWTPDQWAKFKEWIVKFVPMPGKTKPAMHKCSHPVLDFHRITYLEIWGIDGPHWQNREMTITLKCIQSHPPSKKLATSTALTPVATIYDQVQKGMTPPKLGFKYSLKAPTL